MSASTTSIVRSACSLGRLLAGRASPAAGAASAAAAQQARLSSSASTGQPTVGGLRWVFLGPPGVGKGTYASRVAAALGVAHIAAGDLVRAEIKAGSPLGRQMQAIVAAGKLLPDEVITQVLNARLQQGAAAGERGFILDGYPRTVPQAQQLAGITDVQLALNLSLRHEVLVQKCCGRRICSHCGKNYNVADIYLPADGDRPEIVMPPLSPPPECAPHMETREDDTEPTVLQRLQVYNAGAAPVEAFYRGAGLLLDFEITGGIPETTPRLMAALQPHIEAAAAAAAAAANAASSSGEQQAEACG